MTKKSEELKESKELEETRALEKLVESYKEKKDKVETIDEFLRKYNPWKGKNFDGLLDDFLEALKKDDKEFSWLKIDNGLYNELKDKNGRAASIDYGIPSHVRGDIEKGTVFLCLVNPNIDVKVAMCEACQMKNEEDIKKYIFNPGSEGGILYKELDEKGIEKPGYYTDKYLNGLLKIINDSENVENNENSIDYKEISKKIVNLEAFPFRSSSPGFARKTTKDYENRFANCLVKSTSKVSMLSARIIIWKILEYIVNPKDNVKPVFIFRRFNRAWRPSIENVLKKDFFEKNKDDSVKEDKDDSVKEDKAINIAIDNIIKKLHEEFFYTIGPKDHDNMLKMSKNLYKNDEKISINEGKENEFNELIINALSLPKNN